MWDLAFVLRVLPFVVFLALPFRPAHGDELECGSLQNAFGPFDYRDASKGGELHLVEIAHFTSDVQALRRGTSSFSPINDIDYTLRAFPNHWPALDAVSRFALNGGNLLTFRTAECYFDRATRFVPDDGKVHLLYGIHLMRARHNEDARKELLAAEQLSPESVDVAYNLGLLYLRLGETDKASEKARFAYGRGYPLPGLKEALRKSGAWKEPDP